jgi:hypothetical protein
LTNVIRQPVLLAPFNSVYAVFRVLRGMPNAGDQAGSALQKSSCITATMLAASGLAME